MASDFGISFVPGQNPQQRSGQAVEPVQQAIKYLSLRLPKFQAGGPGGGFAPTPLLGGMGSAGNPLARNAIGQTQGRYLTDVGGPSGASGDALLQALLSLARLGPNLPGAPQPGPFTGGPTSGPNLPAPPQAMPAPNFGFVGPPIGDPGPPNRPPSNQPPMPTDDIPAPARPIPFPGVPPPGSGVPPPPGGDEVNPRPLPDVSIQPVGNPRPMPDQRILPVGTPRRITLDDLAQALYR